MFAIGLNYKSHAEEAGVSSYFYLYRLPAFVIDSMTQLPIPTYPVVFTKFGGQIS